MTVELAVTCPGCDSSDVSKNGTRQGKPRYLCQNPECPRCTFILDDPHQGAQREVKLKIGEMTVNGRGIRDTARVLKNHPHTVRSELKKKAQKSNKSIFN